MFQVDGEVRSTPIRLDSEAITVDYEASGYLSLKTGQLPAYLRIVIRLHVHDLPLINNLEFLNY